MNNTIDNNKIDDNKIDDTQKLISIIKEIIDDSLNEIIMNKLDNIKSNKKKQVNDIDIVSNKLHNNIKEYVGEMIDVVLKDL